MYMCEFEITQCKYDVNTNLGLRVAYVLFTHYLCGFYLF